MILRLFDLLIEVMHLASIELVDFLMMHFVAFSLGVTAVFIVGLILIRRAK